MQIVDLTDQTFTTEIADGTVVLDFYADWCVPCKPVSALIDKLVMKYPTVKFCKVNVDKCPSVVASAQISNIPTVWIMFQGEMKTAIYTGFDKQVEREIRKYI